ncbi:MAG TPA: ABC transporter permease subunit [Actinomycetota bacterium]|nr:ABC transporter permease subunit [Actinomycetota bacterium]
MSMTTMAAYRSEQVAGEDSFAALLRAEWTKFRSVRAWLIASAVAGLLIAGFALLNGAGSHTSYCPGPPQPCVKGGPPVSYGPGGEQVDDTYEFVHQPLDGNGSITVELTSMTGLAGVSEHVEAGHPLAHTRAALEPWAKAGLIITENTSQGSPYAAVMATGGNGVRFQWNYTGDTAGLPGPVSASSPRWLRLTRSGDTLTGSVSTGGASWTTVGSTTLAGLPETVQAGMFVTSPLVDVRTQHLMVTTGHMEPSQLTAVFTNVSLGGQWPAGSWSGDNVGQNLGPDAGSGTSAYAQTGGTFTISGSGNIAPSVDNGPGQLGSSLGGAFIGLIVVAVVGVLFITSEFRRGMIRTTLAASPRRGRVLAAKAAVIGAVTFVVALIGASAGAALGEQVLRANGNYVPSIGLFTTVRVIGGTAAVLAVTAVFSLAIGSILRRSAGAVTATIVLTLVPMILVTSGLPAGPSEWILRLFPAAGFAVQQTVVAYHQVGFTYAPVNGYFPLPYCAGFAVLCVWAAGALALAVCLLNRRDT